MSKNKKGKEKNVKEIEITDENTVSGPEENAAENELADEQRKEESTEEKLIQLEDEVSGLKDKLLRKAAEFENYKRRTENDQMNLLTYAAESFIQKLLPVVDDFERSLDHINDAQDVEAIKKGLKLIYDKFIKILDEQGVKKIEAVGEPFDVEFHEALMQREDDSVEPHTVVEEIEKGYIYKDKVIRHTKVIVSEESSTEEKK